MRILAPKSCVVDAYMEIVERAYSLEADTNAVTECLIRLDATSNHTSMLLRFELGDIVFLSAADSCPSEWDEVPEIFFQKCKRSQIATSWTNRFNFGIFYEKYAVGVYYYDLGI